MSTKKKPAPTNTESDRRKAIAEIELAAHAIFPDAIDLYARAHATFYAMRDESVAHARDLAFSARCFADDLEEQVAKLRAAADAIDEAARAEDRESGEGGGA